jgi:hypothetical protein
MVRLGAHNARATSSPVRAHVLSVDCTDAELSDSGTVARTVSLSLLAFPVNGAVPWRDAELRVLSILDDREGRTVPDLGHIERVHVDKVEPMPTGLKISARLIAVAALPVAA